MTDLAAQGVAILMISSELPEVLGMSDRIAVMYRGTIAATLDRAKDDAGEDSRPRAGPSGGEEVTSMRLNRYKQEFSASLAYAVLLAAGIYGMIAASFQRYKPARPRAEQCAGFARRGGHDARDSRRADRYLRVTARGCDRRRGRAGKAGVPIPLLLPLLVLIGAAMGAVNGLLDRNTSVAVDHRDARDAGRVARRVALDHRWRVGAKPAGKLSMVWTRSERGPVG